MVTDEMVERAARAMCEAWHYSKIGTPDGDAEWRKKQDQYRKQSRAALEAALSAAEPVDDENNPRIGNFDIEEASIDDGAEIAKRLALPPQGQEVATYTKLADALEACDWAGCSIGNKAILLATVKELRNVAPPSPSVAVKAFEWNPYRAETPFGYYDINDQRGVPESELKGRDPFLLTGSRLDYSRHPTLDAARAAAQADYEARIRSALSAQVQDVAGWQLVPVNMTAAMINAWSGGKTVSTDENAYHTTFQDAWARVLAAAPAKQEG